MLPLNVLLFHAFLQSDDAVANNEAELLSCSLFFMYKRFLTIQTENGYQELLNLKG